MHIKKWKEIINPKRQSRKKKKVPASDAAIEKKEEDEPEAEEQAENEPDPIKEIFERRSIQSDLRVHSEEDDRKMSLKDFDLKDKKKEKKRVNRIRALAESYPFMFEKDFIEELGNLEGRDKKKEKDEE